MQLPLAKIQTYLLTRLKAASRSHTFSDLVRSARREIGVDRRALAEAVRDLLAQGRLTYAQRHGRSVLEISYRHGLKISNRIVLISETASALPPGQRIGLRLASGAAFGAGDHPTTRLALGALDAVFASGLAPGGARVLDVGTGSGILAIASLLLGAAEAVGLDNDPIALWEARQNARINAVAERFAVQQIPLAAVDGFFQLILANLRLPTLLRMGPDLVLRLSAEGAMVVSGIRPGEEVTLLTAYQRIGILPLNRQSIQGWSAIVFGRHPERQKRLFGPQSVCEGRCGV